MAIYPEAHPKATEESFPARDLIAFCVLPASLQTGASALSFSWVAFLGRSISRHPTRMLSDVAPSYSRFPARVLIGFSFGLPQPWGRNILSGQFEFIDATTVRNPFDEPISASDRSPHVFMGLETFVSDQRARSLFSVGCAYLKLKYRGGISSAPAPASLHPYLVSSRLCETRRSATNFGCAFPANSQEPLNETL
jgi:hypothetical protein